MSRRTIRLKPGEAALVFTDDGEIVQHLSSDDDDADVSNADVMVATVTNMIADEGVFSSYWERTLTELLAEQTEQDILSGILAEDDDSRLN